MVASNLRQVYAQAMSVHGLGHALYEPQSISEIQPGSVGYLDSSGLWTPMVNVTDGHTTIGRGLGGISLGKIKRAKTDTQIWGPKASSSVDSVRVGANVGIDGNALGIPAEASTVFSFSSLKSTGAMLLTSPSVKVERLYYDTVYIEWAKQNASKLFSLYPDAKKHGFYVVTATYTARRAATIAWSDPNKSFSVGFSGSSVGLGEIAPASEWYCSSHGDGWIDSEANPGDEKTVFFGGIFFRPRRISVPGHSIAVKEQARWTSGRSANTSPAPMAIFDETDQTHIEIEVSFLGEILEPAPRPAPQLEDF